MLDEEEELLKFKSLFFMTWPLVYFSHSDEVYNCECAFLRGSICFYILEVLKNYYSCNFHIDNSNWVSFKNMPL
jgi:hypothetical protein